MTDDLNDEMAQASTALFIQHGIDAIRGKLHSARVSKAHCECCGAEIPPARQKAVPGVERCAACQEVKERQSRHRVVHRGGQRYDV